MKAVKTSTLLSLLVLTFVSCTPYTLVQSKVLDKSFNFNQFKTYSIIAADPSSMPPGLTMMDYKILAGAIQKQMQIRGYQFAENSPIKIQIGITVKEDIQTKDAIPTTSRMYFGPRASYLRNYYNDAKVITSIKTVGRLTIDIIDDAKQLYLYTATVSSIMDPNNQKIKNRDEVEAAVAQLFKNYPVQPIE